MEMPEKLAMLLLFLVAASVPLPVKAQDPGGELMGAILFERNCAACHSGDSSNNRGPDRESLRSRRPEVIYEVLTTGPMAVQAADLSDQVRRTIAEYVAGRPFGSDAGHASSMPNQCVSATTSRGTGSWSGWSPTVDNARYQPAAAAGLTRNDVPNLGLKWAFGFPGGGTAYGQPTVVDGTLFTSSDAGFVYALDASTGCVKWSFEAQAGVRGAVSVGPVPGRSDVRRAAFFADVRANAYAVDADTGTLLWTHKVDDHPTARNTGAVTLFNNTVYVPLSSFEELAGPQPDYECCKFRGSVTALDAATGEVKWKSYTIREEPRPTRRNSVGTQLWGPAGAGTWGSPTIDTEKPVIYIGTGNAYTTPAAPTSDAILAFNRDTGDLLWAQQKTANDAWILSCDRYGSSRTENCPDAGLQNPQFRDVDIVQTLLRQLPNGRRILVAGQQTGIAYGLDPDNNGAEVWRYDSEGGAFNFGIAADDELVYLPTMYRDPGGGYPGSGGGSTLGPRGALTAIRIDTGERVWHTPTPAPTECDQQEGWCNGSMAAAPTVIPGVVFAGSRDGVLRAYSTADGEIIWDFNTARDFETVNGVAAKGGSMDGSGPTVVNGMMFVGSGYAIMPGSRAGNILFAFGVD